MRSTPLALLVLVIGSCGPMAPTVPTAQPTSTPSIAPRAGPLFAVVEGGTSDGTLQNTQPDTVAIFGLDGRARAIAKFQPRTLPAQCMFGIPLQGVAEVNTKGVYYIDGSGTVRLLNVGFQPQIVASIAQPPDRYETWFAVSPDGSRVMASVVTWPALGPAPSGAPCPWSYVGSSKFDLQLAAGGHTTVLQHSESSEPGGLQLKIRFPVGWTADGPVAMVPISLGTQNAWWGGPLYVVDSSGNLGRQLGGADCDSASIATSGFIACTSGQYVVTVRDSAGDTLWTAQVDGFNALTLLLSPDGQGISDGTKVETRAGGLVPMPQDFRVEGWLDNNTVAGRILSGSVPDEGNLSWINLNDPGTLHDLGFKGDFVGTIGSSA